MYLVQCILSFGITSYIYFGIFTAFQNLKKKLKIIIKKKFTTNFHFFNRFTQAPTPLSKQPKSTKHDKRFLSRLPKFGKFMVLSLGCSSITFQFHGTNK